MPVIVFSALKLQLSLKRFKYLLKDLLTFHSLSMQKMQVYFITLWLTIAVVQSLT